MARTDASAVVAVEVLVKQRQVAPMRIALKLLRAPVDRPAPVFAAQEDARQAVRKLVRHLPQIHEPAGAGWAFDFETRISAGENQLTFLAFQAGLRKLKDQWEVL